MINSVIKLKNKNPKISISKRTGDKINVSDVPNRFIDYFTTIAEKLTSQMPNASSDVSMHLRNRLQNSSFFAPYEPKEIVKAIFN